MLSVLSRNPYKKAELPKFYELGKIYTDEEIQRQVNIIDNLEKRIQFYQNKIDALNIQDEVLDLVKLSENELKTFKTAKDSISRIKREWEFHVPILKKMESSRSLPKLQPTMKNIIDRAKKEKTFPSKVIDKMDKEIWDSLVFFPDYIIQVAKNLRFQWHKFKDTSVINEPLYPKWINQAIDQEDKLLGSNKYRQISDMRIKAWNDKLDTIRNNEKLYQEDSVHDHVNKPTKKFSREFIKKVNEGRGKEYKTAEDIAKKEGMTPENAHASLVFTLYTDLKLNQD